MRLAFLRGLAVVGLFLAAIVPALPLRAQETTSILLTARAGYDGYYKDGQWVPVRVTLTNNGPSVEGQLRIAAPRYDGTETVYARSVSLPTQSRKEFFVFVNAEGYLSQLKAELHAGRSILVAADTRLTQLGSSDLLYGVVAGSPSAFNMLADVDPVNGAAYVAQLDLADLPDNAAVLRPMDTLVFSDVDTGQLTETQRFALEGWVSGGGHLLVVGGPGWQKTAAGLEALLPVQAQGTGTLPGLATLSGYAGSAEPLSGPAPVGLAVPKPDAQVVVSQDQVPIVVSRRMGYGAVHFLAVDPSIAPLKNWSGVTQLYRNLFTGRQDRPSWANGFSDWYEAAQAVYSVPGLELPSAFQLCGFLGLYVFTIGPLNYLILKRFKRRELAWFTIPALVLVFSGGAYVMGYRIRGTLPVLHRLAVVQVWPDSEVAQIDGLVGVFSPRRAGYDLGIARDFVAKPMPPNYGPIDTSVLSTVMDQVDGTQVRDLRVEVGGLRAFVAQGFVRSPKFSHDLKLDLSGSQARLVGRVSNDSELMLKDAVLLAPGVAERLGDLAPGEAQAVDMLLSSFRATPGLQTNPAVVLPNNLPSARVVPIRPGGTYSAYDTTVDDILGTGGYYEDRSSYRKYALLRAVVNPYSGVGGRGSGVYLAGWTETTSPITADLGDRDFIGMDTTAYMIALNPSVEFEGGSLELPPGLFNWTVPDSGQQGSPSPYEMYVYQGHYVLRFAPIQAIAFRTVEALTLHLASFGAQGPTNLDLALWDYTRADWTPLPDPHWGDIVLPEPGRFVGPGGEIQLRIENANGSNPVNIEASDFTLAVTQ